SMTPKTSKAKANLRTSMSNDGRSPAQIRPNQRKYGHFWCHGQSPSSARRRATYSSSSSRIASSSGGGSTSSSRSRHSFAARAAVSAPSPLLTQRSYESELDRKGR